jgi:hypothetical protein
MPLEHSSTTRRPFLAGSATVGTPATAPSVAAWERSHLPAEDLRVAFRSLGQA